MPDFVYPCFTQAICSGSEIEVHCGMTLGAGDMTERQLTFSIEQPDHEPQPSALPPGSICEICFDQPATQILPAPWGGEMGVCVSCAKGEGDSVESPAGITLSDARNIVQTLLVDAMGQHSVADIPGARVLMTSTEVQAFAEVYSLMLRVRLG